MASGGFGRGGRGELHGGLLAARSIPPPTPTTRQTTATPIQTPSIARGTGHAAMQSTGRGAKPPAVPIGQAHQQQTLIIEQQQRREALQGQTY